MPYKRIDIVVEAFRQNGKKLKVFGDGIDLDRLRSIAGGSPNIEFLGRVSDEERGELYRRCLAYINPQREDFGITIVEAMASGRPVIALAEGGARETVIEGKTGLFFPEETAAAVARAVGRFDAAMFRPEEIRQHALRFSTAQFKKDIRGFIDREWAKFTADR